MNKHLHHMKKSEYTNNTKIFTYTACSNKQTNTLAALSSSIALSFWLQIVDYLTTEDSHAVSTYMYT